MKIQSPQELTFERLRPRLFGLAYRMLGSAHDAEDVVQSAYERWHGADHASLRSEEAWLVAVTTRLCLDRLRQLRAERERHAGDWLPEPIAAGPGALAGLEQGADLSMAFLVLLERLGPVERAAFLLHEVLGAGYDELAAVLERSEVACRQIVHRARARLREGRARFEVPLAARERLVSRFLAAIAAQDEEALLAVVAEDATWISDGGGKVFVARNLRGARRISRFLLTVARKGGATARRELAWINGEPGVVTYLEDRLFSVFTFETDGERILGFHAVLDPDKLRGLGGPGARIAAPPPARAPAAGALR